MELDELEEHDENQMKIGAKPEKKKKDDWKQNFSDINSMKEYIKTNGHKDLQKFTIIGYIGKGSESLVYKVKVNNTNNVFALKVIKKHKNKINLSELILCKKLKHKNLINTLCYYADPNKQFDYMIMEIGNSNLMDFARKILKRLTLSESFLCMVAFQALQGLAYYID
jgi:serine/threonine protein kinase